MKTSEFNAHLQCCFCGAFHDLRQPRGYAGEIQCLTCGKGGNGEPDEPNMFYRKQSK